ncbi:MAG TPA: glycoside hydrolase family 15 protein, partial [Acidimicrobiia bacterium]|nr:glycoside hydrolase family 15 protein [Acidimicrobiia bacterium]
MAAHGGYLPIEDYGVVGDLHTVALVGVNGSIDFCCWPRFDSPTIFAALLDLHHGGRFSIAPAETGVTHRQIYLPDTNVLITRFLSDDGLSEVSDFMPVGFFPHDHPRILVRRVKCVRRSMTFNVVFDPRFDYGRADRTVQQGEGEVVYTSTGPDATAVRLRTPVPLRVDGHGVARATFELSAGEKAAFVMEEVADHLESPAADPHYVSEVFKDTVNYWRSWIGRMEYSGRWREIVSRSALVLKLLFSQTHGSLVAAPTFGLPEMVGGERNWDYRFTWIRDASFTVFALIRLGYTDEAGQFMRWIHDRCMDLNEDGSLQIMYGHDGRKELPEEELGHLEGYRGSSPVRIGNGAFRQLQLDIYGELMDSVYLYNKYGEAIPHELWVNLVRMVNYVCDHWHLADDGLWEVRGGAREFLYSRLMCWVAVDRGIRLADRRSFPYPFERWRSARDSLYHDIMTSFWSPKRQTFVQCVGSEATDASTLLMPMMKFISPTDPRFLATIEAITADLVDDSLVYRYRMGTGATDGLMGDEGTFNMCSFWLAEAVARSGDVQRGRFLFEKTVG